MVRQLGNKLLACYTLTIDQYCVLLLLWMLLYNVWVCIVSVAGLVNNSVYIHRQREIGACSRINMQEQPQRSFGYCIQCFGLANPTIEWIVFSST